MPFLALGCVVILALGIMVAGFMMISVPQTPATTTTPPSSAQTQTACGTGVDTLIPGYRMVDNTGKLGHEQHLTAVRGGHYNGPESHTSSIGFAGGGAFSPHTQDQEHWYFNSQWGGWDWSPTARRGGGGPRLDNSTNGRKARALVRHAKLIVTSVESGKSVIVSAEESGPAVWVTKRDGINFGAPPEVYGALKTGGPYTGNPKDNKGRVKVQFVAASEQKTAKLGPCQ